MKWWCWGLLAAVLVAVFLSPFASPWPDGLEKVAEQKGFLKDAEGRQLFKAPVADYALPCLRSAPLATAAAGFLGTVVAFGLAFGMGRMLARRTRKGRASPSYQGRSPLGHCEESRLASGEVGTTKQSPAGGIHQLHE